MQIKLNLFSYIMSLPKNLNTVFSLSEKASSPYVTNVAISKNLKKSKKITKIKTKKFDCFFMKDCDSYKNFINIYKLIYKIIYYKHFQGKSLIITLWCKINTIFYRLYFFYFWNFSFFDFYKFSQMARLITI